MDGYFQSALAANSLQQNNKNNAISQAAKVITYFPPTNKDFNCTELHTPDGIYLLLHEQFYETIAPQFITGTRASLINISNGYLDTAAANTDDDGSIGSTNSGSHSSSNTTTTATTAATFSMTPVIKSAALPIPKRTPLTTSSSSSSISNGLHIVTSSQRTMTNTASGNNTPYLPYSPSATTIVPNAMSPTSPTTTHIMQPHSLQQQQQFASGSYMMSSSQELGGGGHHSDLFSSSYTGNSSSVSSLSSLFGRSNSTSLGVNKSSTTIPQLSSSTRNNNILSTSITNSSSGNSKPKNHLLKTTSAFVLRFLVHENFVKLLASRSVEDDFLFFNIGSSFIWVDSKSKTKEPLSRIVFSKSYPLCHDVNELTRTDDHLDIIIGFSTGDIIWYDPLSCKYVRLNKGGSMVNAAVSMIKWIPGSEDLFVAVFKNGAVMIMDKERDDQSFTIPEPSSWIESQFNAIRPHKSSKYNPVSFYKISKSPLTDLAFSPDNIYMAITGADGQLRIIDYRNERLTDVFSGYYGKLTCVDWSPDGKYILTGGEDDLVTLWSFHDKKIVARCQGHKSFVTGVAFDRWRCGDEHTYRFGSVGEDCNLILWDFSFSALQKPKHPRVVSTLSPTSLSTSQPKWPPPQPQPQPHPQQQPINIERKKSLKNHRLFRGFSSPGNNNDSSSPNSSTTTTGSFGRFSRKRSSKSSLFTSHTHEDEEDHHQHHNIQQHQHLPVLHPPLKKNQAPILQPTTIKMIHADPCLSLQFREHTLVTTDRRGKIRIWGRP